MKRLTPKAKLGLTVSLVIVLLILLTSLLLAFLKRPRTWEPLDPDAYDAVVLHDACAPVILFGEHAEAFISLVNDQITTRSTASTEGYNSVVSLYGDEGYTPLHFSRYYMYLANLNGNPSFRPNDYRCGPELVTRMKELCNSETDAQPMPTVEEVTGATLTQDGSTVTLDAAQIDAFCSALQQLNTQSVARNLSLREENADWLLKLELSDNISLLIFQIPHFSTNYVMLRFLSQTRPIMSQGRVYRLDNGVDPFAELIP